ncbi:MAG: hypothetical protein WDW38_000753 [Sanguina aurantia]
MKIASAIQKRIDEGKSFFSFEFFPPRTDEGVENLFKRLDHMATYAPVFCDITWGAGGSTADVTLAIAVRMQNVVKVETMMHLTCTNMPVEKLESALEEVKRNGITNILALRGDPPKGQEKFEQVEGGLGCALDLVKYIRTQHGDTFGVCVAGYPEAHPDHIVDDKEQMEKNYAADLVYLKQKVEAGGEMIITQLFYDVEIFIKFVSDCRAAGITVPIVPGIMPIMSYGGFKRMTGFCKTKVPAELEETLEGIKDNEEAVRLFGIDYSVKMCRRLIDSGAAPGVHIYTLNVDKSALSICEQLGFIAPTSLPRAIMPTPQEEQAAAAKVEEAVAVAAIAVAAV